MKAIKWAQKRNFCKFRLEGIVSNMRSLENSSVMTTNEQQIIADARATLEVICSKGWWNSETFISKLKNVEDKDD